MSLRNLTWRCHVCGKERPDDKISVFVKPIFLPDGRICGQQNIHYCNDNPDCIKKAKDMDFLANKRD